MDMQTHKAREQRLVRWGLRAVVAAITTAGLARLTGTRTAYAGHDATSPYDPMRVLHLGEDNRQTKFTSMTAIRADSQSGPGLQVTNGAAYPQSAPGLFLTPDGIQGYALGRNCGVVGFNNDTNADAKGVLGRADHGIGVYGDGGRVGVRGGSNTGTGVLGVGASVGVTGTAFGGSATGVVAENSAGGVGLRVVGRARFSTCGNDVIAAGQASRPVANPAVGPNSHISVSLTGDPGRAQLLWVERQPGTGFTVHLTRGVTGAVPFSYVVVEP